MAKNFLPDEFRKNLGEYEKVLIIKFPPEAGAEEDVGRSLLRNRCAPDTASDLKEGTKKFWDAWDGDKRRILLAMLELEKIAFDRDYTLAVALTGTCPASPALQDGAKGHNMKGNYLTGKPRPLERGASQQAPAHSVTNVIWMGLTSNPPWQDILSMP